jgi:hypothetical protein
MMLDKLAPWELDKLLSAINVVRDLVEQYWRDDGAYSDREMTLYEDALLALKLVELEVRVARSKE